MQRYGFASAPISNGGYRYDFIISPTDAASPICLAFLGYCPACCMYYTNLKSIITISNN